MLTPKQAAEKERIEKAKTEYFAAYRAHRACVAEQGGDSMHCAICRKDMGWWCPKSKDHMCHYNSGSEWCIHCGDPSERK